jgi:uncharacterized protein
MLAAALRFELRFPNAHSLKEKRALLKPLIEGLRMSVSVAEVGHHDVWQRSTVGVAVVAVDGGRLDRLIDEVRRYVESHIEVEMLEVAVSYMEEPE